MSLLHLTLSAALATPTVEDGADAAYLQRAGQHEQAAAWYQAHMEAEPDEVDWLVGYLRSLQGLPERRSPVLVDLALAWQAAHPEVLTAGIPVAMAHGLSALSSHNKYDLYPQDPGSWCDQAITALSPPADPVARYEVLRAQLELPAACGLDARQIHEELEVLGLSGEAGSLPRALLGRLDGVDEEDVAAVRMALMEDPHGLNKLRVYFEEEAEGEVEAVRALLLEAAQEQAGRDQISYLVAAGRVLMAAERREEALPIWERVEELFPDAWWVKSALRELRRDPHAEEGQEEEAELLSTTLLDPQARLEALREQGPPKSSWRRGAYWSARAELARELELEEELATALWSLWRAQGMHRVGLQLVAQAALTGEHLGRAKRVMADLLESSDLPENYELDVGGEAWRGDRAKVLAHQALLQEALGRPEQARESLERAAALAPLSPDQLLRLGQLYHAEGRDHLAYPLLGAGLSRARAVPEERREEAATSLKEALEAVDVWPGELGAYQELMRAHDHRLGLAAGFEELDSTPFQGFQVKIDGEDVTLLDLKGPLVIDVWATWCGPCMESLPHLDALAREHEGEITFIALSVDSVEAQANRYLKRRGGSTFTAAFAGPTGMEALGITGIPATFVFDEEHRLIHRGLGWGVGSTELDELLQRMLGTTGSPTP